MEMGMRSWWSVMRHCYSRKKELEMRRRREKGVVITRERKMSQFTSPRKPRGGVKCPKCGREHGQGETCARSVNEESKGSPFHRTTRHTHLNNGAKDQDPGTDTGTSEKDMLHLFKETSPLKREALQSFRFYRNVFFSPALPIIIPAYIIKSLR